MPHVLFAAPSIGSFHLHDRLAELAMRRGHRISILSALPQERAFWATQGLPVRELARAARLSEDPALPLRELAEIDCRLAGHVAADERAWLAAVRRLRTQAAGVLHAFEHDPPDVVLVHEGRTGLHRLIHFAARRLGIGVLHLGEGLLPGTLLCDDSGIDGDSSAFRRAAVDYRSMLADRAFLHAALTSWLGGSTAPAALRRPPTPPSLGSRLDAALRAGLRAGFRHGVPAAQAAWRAWRAAIPSPPAPTRTTVGLPPMYVVALLQRDDSPRVRLDAPAGLDGLSLLRATTAAAAQHGHRAEVVGLLAEPHDPHVALEFARRGFRVESVDAAPAALATAMAVVTINHPLAGAALLHGTPVVHLGRALYGVPGVAVAGRLETLAATLARALTEERPTLRERFLTRVLQREHIWCSAQRPDRNGLNGIMLRLERAAKHPTGSSPLAYRAGPSWPLAAAH